MATFRGSRRRQRQVVPIADINVTPMVDVMLVLLVIFMVAAPLLVTGVTVDLPKTSAAALPTDIEPISITIDEAGRWYIGDEPFQPAEFSARLAALHESRGSDVRVIIRADAGVPYGTVAGLLADVTGSGFTRVALANRPLARQG